MYVDLACTLTDVRRPGLHADSDEALCVAVEADRGVSCLHFLKKRSKARQGGNLVVGGPYGHLSIWSTHFASKQASIAMAYFPVVAV